MEPTPFGQFLLLERLAVGGMAEIYLARNSTPGPIPALIAIKRPLSLYLEDPEFLQLFQDEAKVTVRLSHPNLVRCYEAGVIEGAPYIAMEHIHGRNLKQVLNRLSETGQTLPLPFLLYIVREVASGLESLRLITDELGQPIKAVKRDVSPQDIMLGFDGRVKLLDMGIAKATTQVEETQIGVIKGKVGYMSPEQASDEGVDHRSDIYSLGIIMWEMLAGERLFDGEDVIQIISAVQSADVPSLRARLPELSAEVEWIVSNALAREPADRYQTAAEFAEETGEMLIKFGAGFQPGQLGELVSAAFEEDLVSEKVRFAEFLK